MTKDELHEHLMSAPLDLGDIHVFKGESARGRREGVIVEWAVEGAGFGELTVRFLADGTVFVDSERMSKEFAARVWAEVLAGAKFEWEEE